MPDAVCHHIGLNRSFSSGVVYCSPITATLLIKDMGLPAERVIPLSVDHPHVIDGVTVTLMDANHCPGACMMLFKVPSNLGKPQVRCVQSVRFCFTIVPCPFLKSVFFAHVCAKVSEAMHMCESQHHLFLLLH